MTDKVKVSARDLFDVLTFLKPFIPDQATISSYTKMAWQGKTMMGQDGIVGAAITAPVNAPASGIVIEGPRMTNFLSAIGKKDVTVHFTDKSVSLAGGGSKAVFRFATAEDANFAFPVWPKKAGFKKPPEGFRKALNAIDFCADTSGKAGPLSSVYINNGFMVASDGSRAARVKMDFPSKEEILLPLRTVKLLDGDEPTHLQLAGTILWFAWKSKFIFTRLVEPSFPDLNRNFEEAQKLAKRAPAIEYDCKEMAPALQAAASAGGFGIEGIVDGSKITFVCTSDLTDIKVSRPIKKGRGEGSFYADPTKLKEAFTRFPKLAICGSGVLYFFDPETKAEHIVMELVKDAPKSPAKGEDQW